MSINSFGHQNNVAFLLKKSKTGGGFFIIIILISAYRMALMCNTCIIQIWWAVLSEPFLSLSASSIIKNYTGALAPAIRVCFKYQTLFKDSAIQQEGRALNSDRHHIIFYLPYSIIGNFSFFHVHQDLCWALNIHTINLTQLQNVQHFPRETSKAGGFFSVGFIYLPSSF